MHRHACPPARRAWIARGLTLLLPLALPALARSQPARPARPAAGGFVEIKWDDLVPKGWDPLKGLGDVNVGVLDDTDPKVIDMMRRLREVWDNAPTVAALDGSAVRLPGYLVPLDDSRAGMTEFLLVPYFGACIHSPPPPANQIVLVQPAKPLQGYRSMDTVWVRGTLRTARAGSPMGTSAYRLEAALVDRYTGPEK